MYLEPKAAWATKLLKLVKQHTVWNQSSDCCREDWKAEQNYSFLVLSSWPLLRSRGRQTQGVLPAGPVTSQGNQYRGSRSKGQKLMHLWP
jgi:hypothetical protein